MPRHVPRSMIAAMLFGLLPSNAVAQSAEDALLFVAYGAIPKLIADGKMEGNTFTRTRNGVVVTDPNGRAELTFSSCTVNIRSSFRNGGEDIEAQVSFDFRDIIQPSTKIVVRHEFAEVYMAETWVNFKSKGLCQTVLNKTRTQRKEECIKDAILPFRPVYFRSEGSAQTLETRLLAAYQNLDKFCPRAQF